jgi:hypothetical protein
MYEKGAVKEKFEPMRHGLNQTEMRSLFTSK